ncbi:MAG TPA: aspartyl protease family protein [Vicinamibacterales bacterium]
MRRLSGLPPGQVRRLGLVLLFCAAAAAGSLTADDTQTPEVYVQLGDLLLQESRYREAAAAYERVDDGADPDLRARAAAGLTRALLRSAQFGRARQAAERLVALEPQSPDAITLHGDALWGVGLFPEAEARYREALAVDPAHARAHHGLARTLSSRRRFTEALDHIRIALARLPGDYELHHTEGFIFDRLGRYAEAAASLRRFQTLLPPHDREQRALLVRAQIGFLESFGDRTPFEMKPEVANRIHTVPFRIVNDKIVVKGSVNGSRPLDVILDTGAEMTVISRRTAERQGIRPLGFTVSAGVGEVGMRGLQLGRVDELRIGTFSMRNIPVLVKNPTLPGLPMREGESWSPVALGLSTIIDYGRKQLTFGKGPLPPGELDLPLYFHRLAMVRGTVNGREPASFVVDTGGEVISISTAVASAIGPSRMRRIPLKVYGVSGWDRDAFLYPGLNLAFDQIRFDNFATVVLNLKAPSTLLGIELGGIVGHRFLSRYLVGIDLEAGRLRLTECCR